MKARTDDSTVTNLRELVRLEEERTQAEQNQRVAREHAERARVEADRTRARREAEIARAAEEIRARAESERIDAERVARDRAREDLELRTRLESEARAAASRDLLAHSARIEALQRVGTQKSATGTLIVAAAVVVLGVLAGAVALQSKIDGESATRRAEYAREERAADARLADVRARLVSAQADVRAAQATLAAIPRGVPAIAIVPPRIGIRAVRPPRGHVTVTTTAVDPLVELERDGSDPITRNYEEGGRNRRPRHR